MTDQKNDIILPAGTPLLVVGFDSAYCSMNAHEGVKSLPHVYAGRLQEPHQPLNEEDKTFLFEQGPMVLSIDPKTVGEKAFFRLDSGTGIFILACDESDQKESLAYFIAEDREGIVDAIDGSENLGWQDYASFQQKIFFQVMTCCEDLFCSGTNPFTSP